MSSKQKAIKKVGKKPDTNKHWAAPKEAAKLKGVKVATSKVSVPAKILKIQFSHADIFSMVDLKIISPAQAKEMLGVPDYIPKVIETHPIQFQAFPAGLLQLYSDGKALWVPKDTKGVKSFKETGLKFTIEADDFKVEDADMTSDEVSQAIIDEKLSSDAARADADDNARQAEEEADDEEDV